MSQRLAIYTQRLLDAAQTALYERYHHEVAIIQRVIDAVMVIDPDAAQRWISDRDLWTAAYESFTLPSAAGSGSCIIQCSEDNGETWTDYSRPYPPERMKEVRNRKEQYEVKRKNLLWRIVRYDMIVVDE